MSEAGQARVLRVGTRGSALALAQSRQTVGLLERSGIAVELVVIRTSGDKLKDVPLAKVGGKGLFIKELEEALADGRIDLAIHSMKDVPAVLPDGFTLAAVTRRADPRDVLVVRSGLEIPRLAAAAPPQASGLERLPLLAALPAGVRVGTGSLRRRAQIAALRPDLGVVPLRGNVDTRLGKLRDGVVDAIVLASAGIERLGLEPSSLGFAAEWLDPEVFLPAPGQGALAIEARADDRHAAPRAAVLHDPASAAACAAERAFLRALGASCQVPVAAFARRSSDPKDIEARRDLIVEGLTGSLDGKWILRDRVEGCSTDAESLGGRLAEMLIGRGARELLAEAERVAGVL
jgi:hydroxymethylbilane synthase